MCYSWGSVLFARLRRFRLVRFAILLTRIAIVGAFLLNSPIIELFSQCDDSACEDGDDERDCHCPPGCPCSVAHCHPGPDAVPSPVGVAADRTWRELDGPERAAPDTRRRTGALDELLKVPKPSVV